MPKALVSYVRYMELFTTRLGKILSGAVFVLIGILLIEAVARYIFNNPTPWSIELATFVFGTYFLFGGGYVLLRGGHVRMDALYNRWSLKTRAIVNAATFSLLAVYLIVFILGGISNITYTLAYNVHSTSQWAPPLAPIRIIVVVGAGLLLLQGVAILIRDIATIRGKRLQ